MESSSSFFDTLIWLSRIGAEVAILAFLIYFALLFIRGTRSITILIGIAIVTITVTLMAQLLGLEVIQWILGKVLTVLALFVFIIFQPEIRRAFAEIGSQRSLLKLHGTSRRDKEIIDTLLDATYFLADHRIGALFAIEQRIGTRMFAETGTAINAPVSVELLSTIFFPNTPLHDGAVIIRNGNIVAAGCILPLTQSVELSKSLGTRHRAGVGITEETDAVAIIVSEETGGVSLAYRGRLIRGVKRQRLERHLTNYLVRSRLSGVPGALGAGIEELRKGMTDDGAAVDEEEEHSPL